MFRPVIIAAAAGAFAALAFFACRRCCRCVPGKPAPEEIDTWESEGGCVSVGEGKTMPQVPQTTPAG